LKKI
jgi:hypothetical protein